MLKYLFTAEYDDGSTYEQNAEDVSVKEPEKRSCFFDIDQERVVRFTLKGEGHTYTVDLTDGHFEVNGVPFKMHEEDHLDDYRLIFWRRHRHSFNVGAEKNEELSHETVYRVGWQATFKGEKREQVMQID